MAAKTQQRVARGRVQRQRQQMETRACSGTDYREEIRHLVVDALCSIRDADEAWFRWQADDGPTDENAEIYKLIDAAEKLLLKLNSALC